MSVDTAKPVVTAACFFVAGGPWVRPSPGIPCALVSQKFGRMCERAVDQNRPLLELSPLRPKAISL
jgi:hypothetical protein